MAIALLDLLVVDDAALLGVHQEHAAGLQAALLQHVLRRDVEHAGFGRHDDQVVLRHVIARRTQAVAIEHRADLLAVGERDRRRAVPRLHQRGVVLVERALRVVHGLVVRPRLGNHHHHRVRQRPAGQHEQLERVVEHRRVEPFGLMIGRIFLMSSPNASDCEQRFARMHPVGVAAQRVDFAVVRDVAIRMRAVPARERVRAETRVHQRQRGFHRGIAQIREILRELLRQQHAFVDERLVRQARDVPGRGAFQRRGADLAVGALADDVELALERQVVR